MIRPKKICSLLILLISIICFAASSALAADALQGNTLAGKFGPIDLKIYMQKAIETAVTGKDGDDATESYASDSRAARMFAKVMTNDWLITRTLMCGFSNFDGAVQVLEDEDAIRQELARKDALAKASAAGQIAEIGRDKNYAGGNSRGGSQYSNKNNNQNKSQNNSQYNEVKITSMISSFKNIAENIKDLEKLPGFTSRDSIYMRVSYLSFLLLSLVFALKLATIFYHRILGISEQEPYSIVAAVIKLILFIIYIFALKWGVMCMLLFSELLRDGILGISNASQATDLTDGLQTLIQAKGILIGMNGSRSLFDWVTHSASSMASSVIGYVCYALTGAFIFVIVLLGDIMMGISVTLGPLLIALSMIKGFESWSDSLFRGIVEFSLYMPIAAIYMVTMTLLQALIPTMSFGAYLAVSYAFLFGCTKIPNLSEALSGAALAAIATQAAGKIVGTIMSASTLGLKKAILHK